MLPIIQNLFIPVAITLLTVLSGLVVQNSNHVIPNTPTSAKTMPHLSITPSIIPTNTSRISHTSNISHNSLHETMQVTNTPVPSQMVKENSISNATSPTPIQNIIDSAHTTISASGKTINLSLKYPKNGGAISGVMSGDCSGTLSGNYDGPTAKSLTGTGNASCPVGFISVPVTISYTGTLISDTQVEVNYIVNAMGKSQAGNTLLTVSE